MTQYKEQILACDFVTVETIRLQTLYVLFFIELSSRRIHLAGVTANPNEMGVTQQARQLIWKLDDREPPLRFLINDHDGKFTDAFDTLFRSEGLRSIPTPSQAPNANSYAERWVLALFVVCNSKPILERRKGVDRNLRPLRIGGWPPLARVSPGFAP